MTNEALAVTMLASAMRKRTIAEALWQEAEKDLAKAKEMLEQCQAQAPDLPKEERG